MEPTLRERMDEIDERLIRDFTDRMKLAGEISDYKKEHGIPVLDRKRETEKLRSIMDKSPEEIREYSAQLYSMLFEFSRSYQNRRIGTGSELTERIRRAVEETPSMLPDNACVACQGIEGANSHIACGKLFRYPMVMFFDSFGAVFNSIEKGLCRYGVIPVENSTAGSVNSVYDLMMEHKFSIVRSMRLKVDHNLLALPSSDISQIREIYSHPQAISQCSAFLESLRGVRVVPCENTAIAAKRVAESGRNDIAALSSKQCMDYYGLKCLKASVQDSSSNYTRFICISKDLEIYPGADRTSIMATLPHEPGSLYKLLSKLYALGINLNKLESRPIPDRDFEFMFYFDLDTPVYSPSFMQFMGELSSVYETFTYLGSYSEIL
ncbi:MAG: chorismate mutase [Lachnospiraceae bacterium]|nr:chorismate mutase [Lachnospiraceae bacterium]